MKRLHYLLYYYSTSKLLKQCLLFLYPSIFRNDEVAAERETYTLTGGNGGATSFGAGPTTGNTGGRTGGPSRGNAGSVGGSGGRTSGGGRINVGGGGSASGGRRGGGGAGGRQGGSGGRRGGAQQNYGAPGGGGAGQGGAGGGSGSALSGYGAPGGFEGIIDIIVLKILDITRICPTFLTKIKRI